MKNTMRDAASPHLGISPGDRGRPRRRGNRMAGIEIRAHHERIDLGWHSRAARRSGTSREKSAPARSSWAESVSAERASLARVIESVFEKASPARVRNTWLTLDASI